MDDQMPVCGEMIFDTALINEDTRIFHECGEWRPKLMLTPGGTEAVYDYSWHHPGGGYYGGYGRGLTEGVPTPSTDPGEEGNEPQPDTPEGPSNPEDLPAIPSVDTAARLGNCDTRQTQWGWAPPESPAFSQRVNIFQKLVNVNVVGTFIFTKPQGYSRVQIDTWLKVSDPIPAGEEIEMDLKVGEWDDDKGPVAFGERAVKLNSTNISPGKFKRIQIAFKGLDATRSRAVTAYFERRNDLTPQPDVEVWTVRHLPRFFA